MRPSRHVLIVGLQLACVLATMAALTSNAAATDAPTQSVEPFETVVSAPRHDGVDDSRLPNWRATSLVLATDLELRLPRSAPDALLYEPGVFVQQTAHAQASPYLRGLTGQETLLVFDGIRLNNAVFRQGPNQYFFTVDTGSVARLEVLRGGGSTQWGSDALGGVLLAVPVEPEDGRLFVPRLTLSAQQADEGYGARVEAQGRVHGLRWRTGIAARHFGLLEGGGIVHSPTTGEPAAVPRLLGDERTQRGTGFDDFAADLRLVQPLEHGELVLASYGYVQTDAPRTDRCPPPGAEVGDCLTYDEQLRWLTYLQYRGSLGGFSDVRASLSWQRQHEERSRVRPTSTVRGRDVDTVDALGLAASGRRELGELWAGARAAIEVGADAYVDWLGSRSYDLDTTTAAATRRSRGQYLDDARYATGGAFAQATVTPHTRMRLHAGGRVGSAHAKAPADVTTSSASVDRRWLVHAANAGVALEAAPWLALHANGDLSFRAPNLDDLTARQQTGAGFQLENTGLDPEQARMAEVGLVTRGRVAAEVWAYSTWLTDDIEKRTEEAPDCPPETPDCGAARTVLRLVNVRGASRVHGVEAGLRGQLGQGLSARATATMTRTQDPDGEPRSKTPPTNGTAELTWSHASGLRAVLACRWAVAQTRLSEADRGDARIPDGGTPSFSVVDVGAGYHSPEGHIVATVRLDNIFDAAYRAHGSSINGAGRGLVASIALNW